jgi:RNA polymerase sigma factor (sigma-70 family)
MIDFAQHNGGGCEASEVALLVKEAAAGDAAAWNELVDRFAGLVSSIARSHRLGAADADDVSQTVWLRLVEGVGSIRDPERIGAWLAAVTRHEALRMLRRSGREVPVADTGMEDLPSGDRAADDDLLATERTCAVREAVDRLPMRTRAVMRGLLAEPSPSYGEVAADLGIPVNSVGPTRSRALRTLRHSPVLAAVGFRAGSAS